MQTTVDMLEPSEREKITEFMKAHPVGVLATVDAGNNPHASTIYIKVDDALNITFTTKRDTLKYQNIARNNHVMLAVYETETQQAVQVSGQAKEVSEPQAQAEIYKGTLEAAKQTGPDVVPPIAKLAAGPYVAFKIEVENIWASDYGWGNNFAQALKYAADPHSSGDPV